MTRKPKAVNIDAQASSALSRSASVSVHEAVRFIVHLPFRDRQEEEAAKIVAEHYEFEYGGSTYSSLKNPSFIGTWKSAESVEYKADVCVLNIDIIIKNKDQYKSRKIEIIQEISNEIIAYVKEAYYAKNRCQKSVYINVNEMSVVFSSD